MSDRAVSRAEFARHCHVNKSTVTRWADAGMLVLDDSGRVLPEASLLRLQNMRGGRPDVEARHAAERGAAIPTIPSAVDLGTAAPQSSEGGNVSGNGVASRNPAATSHASPEPGSLQAARRNLLAIENAHAKLAFALRLRLRYLLGAVRDEGAGLGGMQRAGTERVTDQLAPRLAVLTDPADRRRLVEIEARRLQRALHRELPAALRRLRQANEGRKAA